MTATPFVVSCLKNNNLGWTGTEAFSVSTHALEQGLFKSLNPFRIKLVDFLFDALHIVEWIWLEKSAFEFVYFFCPPYSSLLECVPFVCLTLIPYQFPQIYGIFSSGNWLTVFITVVCSFPRTHRALTSFFSMLGTSVLPAHPKSKWKDSWSLYHPLKPDSLSSSFTVKWLQWHH